MVGHPDRDLLADLAAEVLPDHEARLVEAHVIGCARCADLLAEAERVRQLLRAPDPGPMPEAVWRRLAATLSAQHAPEVAPAVEQRAAPPAPEEEWVTAQWPVQRPWLPDGASDPPAADAPTSQWQRFVDEDAERADQEADREVAPPARVPAPASVPRPGRGMAMRTRRDVRTESHLAPWVRYGRLLAVAAGVVLVAGLAVTLVLKLPLGGGSSATTAAGGAAPAAAGAYSAVLLESGTNYTAKDIASRASALVTAAARPVTSPGGTRMASGAAMASVAGSASAAAPLPSAAVESDTNGGGSVAGNPPPVDTAKEPMSSSERYDASTGLTDPARLAACLAKLNASNRRPVAVDLARFNGAQAAVIVLEAPDGTREVFAVSRTCGDGNDPQVLHFEALP